MAINKRTDASPETPSKHASLRVAKNTLILVTLRVVMPALAVTLVLALSRCLGAEGLGRYTLAFTYLYLINAIAPLGLPAVITREGARNPEALTRVFQNSLSLGVIASTALTAVMLSVSTLLQYDMATHTALVIVSFAVLPCTVGALQESSLVARERIGAIAIATATEYVIKVGAGLTLLLAGYGLEAVLILGVAGRIVGCVVCGYFLHKDGIQTRFRLDSETSRQLLRWAPTFVAIGVFATLYWRIDVFMLSKIGSVEDVGFYGAAWRILELAMVFPQSLCLALYPRISAMARSDGARLTVLGATAARYMFAVSLPIALGATILAAPVLELLYGKAFSVAASTLIALMWTFVPYGFVRYHAYVLVGGDYQRVDLVLNVVMSAVNVLLNLILIPRFGHLGAALATLASICAYALLQYLYLRRNLPGHATMVLPRVSVIVGSAIAVLAAWAGRGLGLGATIPIACMIYFAVLLAGRFFTREELELVGMQRLLATVDGLRRV
jgi:O-antigen/teichoic acid export membrane protein